MKSRIILLVLIAIAATPLWMRIGWEFMSTRKLDIVIVDKTVLNTNSFKHRSINWILDHEKYVKPDGSFYDINKDYYGFFPEEDEHYTIRDFDTMNDPELDSLADVTDIAYFADTYGIMGSDWYKHLDRNDNSGSIYGGLSEKDLLMMRKMHEKNKLVIAEFNSIGFPTPEDMRKRFEEMYGITWTGWMVRSIASLDTVNNPDLPRWIIRQYKNENNGNWPFVHGGILCVHESGKVVVMEDGRDLSGWIPDLNSKKELRSEAGVPEHLIYPYWTDVWKNENDSNEIAAQFILPVNKAGAQLLEKNGLTDTFPAVIRRTSGKRFYYFCGDFADNPTKFRFNQLAGITGLKFLLYNAIDKTDRNRFFWEYYLPLMQRIFKDAYRLKPKA